MTERNPILDRLPQKSRDNGTTVPIIEIATPRGTVQKPLGLSTINAALDSEQTVRIIQAGQVVAAVQPNLPDLVEAVTRTIQSQVGGLPKTNTEDEIKIVTDAHQQNVNNALEIVKAGAFRKETVTTTETEEKPGFLDRLFGKGGKQTPTQKREGQNFAGAKLNVKPSTYHGPSFRASASASQHKSAGAGFDPDSIVRTESGDGGASATVIGSGFAASSSTIVSGGVEYSGSSASIGGINIKSK